MSIAKRRKFLPVKVHEKNLFVICYKSMRKIGGGNNVALMICDAPISFKLKAVDL